MMDLVALPKLLWRGNEKMSESIKVSIIVPVYNVKDYIDECVNSLLNQDIDIYEIILINDGSTDGSDKICLEYAEAHSKIKYLTQKNCGQSAARNYGMTIARGEYILFVDSDDYICPEACRTLYNAAKNYDADIVVGDILNEKENVENNSQFRWCPAENSCVSTLDFAKDALIYGVYDIVPWIRLVRKEFLISNSINFLEGCYYEDQEYTLRLLKVAKGSVVKIRFPFYYYRMDRVGSTTNYASKKKGIDFINVITHMQELVDLSDKFRADIQCKIIGMAYFHFINLWLRIETKNQNDLYVQFMQIVKSWEGYEKTLELMPKSMNKKVVKFVKIKWMLKMEYEIKRRLKKLLK